MAAVAVMIGYIIEQGPFLSHRISLLLLSISAFFMVSGGNVLNDLEDVEIDRKAHATRPLVAGSISEKNARMVFFLSWSAGILSACIASLMVRAFLPLFIVIMATALIVYYEKRLKGMGMPGNLIVGSLTGIPFLLGGSIAGYSPLILTIFLMAFLSNTSREIMKDIQDQDQDIGRRTLPQTIGTRYASFIGLATMFLAVMSSSIPLVFLGWAPAYLIWISVADGVLILSSILLFKNPLWAQRTAKLGMLTAMAVFIIWSII